jgi:hypothetical protein
MKNRSEHKMFMGLGKYLVPIPRVISNKGLEKGVSGAKIRAQLLTEEERKVHHYVVERMSTAKGPITAELISDELGIPLEVVEKAVAKLESLKTFLYRSNGVGINWAYPFSLDDTGHKLTVNTGESFNAA